MIKWYKKKKVKPVVVEPKPGDTKIETIFLWWPFLNEDGYYYWLGYVEMEFVYLSTFTGIIYPMAIDGWFKTKIIKCEG